MKNEISPEGLDRQIIYQSHGKMAFIQEFKRQNGEKYRWFLFGSNDKPVIIFPLTKKHKVIAIDIFRYGAKSFIWEVPGGSVGKFPNWCNVSENNLEEEAKKELKQETGYKAGKIVQIGPPTWFDPASFRVAYTPILALNCSKIDDPKPEPEEIIREIKEIPLKHWIEMIKTGEICDSKTIAITIMALWHLGYDNLIPDSD
jgi:hypothetical protein